MTINDPTTLNHLRGLRACELCGYVCPCEAHHIIARGHGGGSRIDHPYAVIALCGLMQGSDCHYKVTVAELTYRGRLCTASDLFGIVAAREGKAHADLEDAVRLFCRLSPKLNRTALEEYVDGERAGVRVLVRELLRAREKSLMRRGA